MSTYPTQAKFDFETAVAVSDATHVLSIDGPQDRVFEWKSVTKTLASWATLIAVDRGHVSLDDDAGPDGSTLRHLLAHTSGLPFEDGPTQSPERRRVYSNLGFDVLADHVAKAVGTDFDTWVTSSVLEPLELNDVTLTGSAAHGARGTIIDLLGFALEMLRPTLISAELAKDATSVQYPHLPGVLPGFGNQQDNDWGLGLEIRDHKSPHWTAPQASPQTFGHFGQSGSFVWVDPSADLTAVFLGEKSFTYDVHGTLWPDLNAEILAKAGV